MMANCHVTIGQVGVSCGTDILAQCRKTNENAVNPMEDLQRCVLVGRRFSWVGLPLHVIVVLVNQTAKLPIDAPLKSSPQHCKMQCESNQE